MKKVLSVAIILLLAGCGGSSRFDKVGGGARYNAPAVKPFASGPISRACLASDRKARSRELCGCVQAVADQTLTGGQQAKAVKFYSDPQKAQDIRQSKRPGDKAFWKAYSDYGKRAEQTCN